MLAAFGALALTVTAAQLAVILTGLIRTRNSRLFKDASKDKFARQFPIAAIAPSSAEAPVTDEPPPHN